MLVYHGSNVVVENPDVKHSQKFIDFGPGFYVTTFKDQAEKWALRKAMRGGRKPIVNVYEMQDELYGYNVLQFADADGAWLDFVCGCRRGESLNKGYDVIVGNVANDDVFKTVDLYFRGIWDKERTIAELRYYKRNDQINFVTEKVLKLLKFLKSYEVIKQ